MRMRNLMVVFFLLLSSMCFAQNKSIGSGARQQIDAGNQAWIDGIKQGNVALIAATYTPDAVDCNPAGDCIRGRTAIEEHMREEMAKLRQGQLGFRDQYRFDPTGSLYLRVGSSRGPLLTWEQNRRSVSYRMAGAAGRHLEDLSQFGNPK